MSPVYYGTRRVYADIPTEGASDVRTLIAVPGQRISPHFEHLVPDDAKTTEVPVRTAIHQAATVDHPTIVASSDNSVTVDREGQEVVDASAAGGGVPAGELKGKALDEALEDAGLSKDGTADEKRDRLAAHQGAGEGE